jgi:hypothetical protein
VRVTGAAGAAGSVAAGGLTVGVDILRAAWQVSSRFG